MLMKHFFRTLALCGWMLVMVQAAFAHCDTMDGPVVAAGKKAFEKNNVNYALIWVKPEHERELIQAFELAQKVRPLNADARKLSEQYFFETLVRLHRMGEGIAYTGIKASGTPVDPKILAADRSIESGNLGSLEKLVPATDVGELRKRFRRAMALKNYEVNDVKAGREFIEAYVQFFHFAEGSKEGGEHEAHHAVDDPKNIP